MRLRAIVTSFAAVKREASFSEVVVLGVVSNGIRRRGLVVVVADGVNGFWGWLRGVGGRNIACEACACCVCFSVLEACKSNFRNDDLALKTYQTTAVTMRTYNLKSSTTLARYTSASILIVGFSSIPTVDSRCYRYLRVWRWSGTSMALSASAKAPLILAETSSRTS